MYVYQVSLVKSDHWEFTTFEAQNMVWLALYLGTLVYRTAMARFAHVDDIASSVLFNAWFFGYLLCLMAVNLRDVAGDNAQDIVVRSCYISLFMITLSLYFLH